MQSLLQVYGSAVAERSETVSERVNYLDRLAFVQLTSPGSKKSTKVYCCMHGLIKAVMIGKLVALMSGYAAFL